AVSDEMTDKDVISAPEIIAARDGEANLKARLDKENNEVTAQLAQTDNKEKEIRRNKKKIKPQFVFIDDDGHRAVLSKLKPIFTEQNVPLTIALLSTSAVLRAEYGDEVLQLQNQHGWEISSHGNTPEGFSTL